MIRTRLRLALALASLLAGLSAAQASDCRYPTSGGSQCFPTMMIVDPATGQPLNPTSGAGGGGYTGAAAVSPGTNGTTATPVQGVDGGKAVAISGSIANTAFGISGQLPAFASIPTFKIDQTSFGSSNAVVPLGFYQSTTPTIPNNGNYPLLVDVNGNLKTTALIGSSIPAGSAVIGKVGIDQSSPTITNQVYITGYYSPSQASLSVPQAAGIQVDTRGHIKTSETGSSDPLVGITPSVAQSNTALVAKAAQGNLYGAQAMLTAAASATTYLVAINATAVPASGAAITPVDFDVFPSNAIGAKANTINYGSGPPNGYSTGIVLLVTTSLTTYTPGPASIILARAR